MRSATMSAAQEKLSKNRKNRRRRRKQQQQQQQRGGGNADQGGGESLGVVELQVLGNGAGGLLPPGILLHTRKGRFIFNVADGLQRFCVEHRVRLSKVDTIFLSSLRAEHAV